MAIDFAKLITLAVEEGGDQGIYNWPSQVRNVLKKRYGELGLSRDQVSSGGEYGNSFQGALGRLLPANIESTFMANANMYARANGVPIGQQVLQDLNNRRDNVNTGTDADFMKLKAAGDLAAGNITSDDAYNISSYVGNLSFLKDASRAAAGAQGKINTLEREIVKTQQQYDNSRLGKESTKDTYEPRLASLRRQLEQAKADLPKKQERLDDYTSKFNNAYNDVANLNTSMSIVPASQVASLVYTSTTPSSVVNSLQNTINETPASQQAAQQAAQPAQQAAQQLPAELTNIPVDNDYSMDEAAVIENLIRSGRISTQQVSDYFNLPASEINSVLEQSFGYTPQQISQVATPVSMALSGVERDNDYSMEDSRIVENALRTGQVNTQQVSDYFGIPVADISRVLTTDFGYTPAQLNAVGGTTTTTAGTGTTADTTTAADTGAATAADTGAATAADTITAAGTGTTAGGLADLAAANNANLSDADRAMFAGLEGTSQGVGQDLTNVMGGQQGYTGGTLQDGSIRYNDPNVIGAQVNMPQTGVIGAEAALQGGLQGGLAGLQEGLATGATGLTGAVSSGLQELRRALGQGRQDITAGYGRAEEGFQPYMQGGEAAQAQLEALTGARGQEAFQQAYQESPYIQFLREQGTRANLAGAAATGGLGGGNVQKELTRFGQGLASQGLQQQIENLRGLTGQGLQAAQGAGQYAAGGAGQLAGLEQTQGTQALGAMQNVGQQLANLGLAGGQTAAQMGYGTGQSLADIRTRAGELMAGEISNVSRDTSNIATALGGNISNVYGTQAQNIAQLLVNSGMSQADAAQQTAQMLANISTGSAGQVTGLGTSVGQPQQQQGILGQVGQAASGIATAGGSAGFGWW